MGLNAFERLGLLVGRRDGDSPFVCRTCATTYDVEYHVCPDCGGFSVERRVATGSAED